MDREIPVYLFTGFLESGKTRFIQETLEDERFNAGENTLLLVCEEGIEEYQPDLFSGKNVFVYTLESAGELAERDLDALCLKHDCERVIIEYNGMWMLDDLYRALPEGWSVYQEIMFADASTFTNYNNNMRSLVVDKLQSCELVVFNRADDSTDREGFHKLIRAINRSTDISYEDAEGNVTYDTIEDPLPFDINAPIIEIEDSAFALWYRDLNDRLEEYDGKTVRVCGFCVTSEELPRMSFIFGRYIMTCCVQDTQFAGVIAVIKKPMKLENRSWIRLTAKITVRKHAAYDDKGPVLNVISIESAEKPENDVATFY